MDCSSHSPRHDRHTDTALVFDRVILPLRCILAPIASIRVKAISVYKVERSLRHTSCSSTIFPSPYVSFSYLTSFSRPIFRKMGLDFTFPFLSIFIDVGRGQRNEGDMHSSLAFLSIIRPVRIRCEWHIRVSTKPSCVQTPNTVFFGLHSCSLHIDLVRRRLSFDVQCRV